MKAERCRSTPTVPRLRRGCLALILFAGSVTGCAQPTGSHSGSGASAAMRGRSGSGFSLDSTMKALSSGNASRIGPGLTTDLRRQEALDRREATRARLAAERQARVPHAVSAEHTGTLSPVDATPGSLVSGRTLVFEAPIVQNGKLLRVDSTPIYFAANGMSHSPGWTDRSWYAQDRQVCLAAVRGQALTCMTPVIDSAGQAFLQRQEDGRLIQVASIQPGDPQNVRAQFAANEARRAKQEEMAAQFLLALFGGGLGGFGGSGSGGSGRSQADSMMERQAERDRERAAMREPDPPAYSAPPISSFYGSCHNPMGC